MKAFLIVLLVFYANTETVFGNCRNGWEGFNANCYLLSKFTASWSEASAFCAALHSHLAVVRSADEHNFIKSIIAHQTGSTRKSYWVDGTDEEVENVWRWALTDEKITYLEWGPGQPDQTQGGNCLCLWGARGDEMADSACTLHLDFICQTKSGAEISTEIVG